MITTYHIYILFAGTTKIKNLDENVGALSVKLTEGDHNEISEIVKEDEVAGDRIFDGREQFSWRVANTPPKHSN